MFTPSINKPANILSNDKYWTNILHHNFVQTYNPQQTTFQMVQWYCVFSQRKTLLQK